MKRRAFFRNRAAVAGGVVLASLVLACLFLPVVVAHDPYAVDFDEKLQGPSWSHPLGTDLFGRDLLVRLALGGRFSLLVAGGALLLILAFGFLYGAVAGLSRPAVSATLMRLLDGLIALPRLPVLIVILVVVRLNTNLVILMFTLAVVNWMLTARLVHYQIVSLRQAGFVRAAHAIGARPVQVLRRHLLPNSLGILLVAAFLELPALILAEAFVSVLGLGLNPPTPTWGTIAQDGINHDRTYELVLPSVAIGVFAVAANFVADGLQNALQPRRAG